MGTTRWQKVNHKAAPKMTTLKAARWGNVLLNEHRKKIQYAD